MNSALSNVTNKVRLAYANSRLPAFLRWWGSELEPMLPAAMRKLVHYKAPSLAVIRQDDDIVFWRCDHHGSSELARHPLDEEKDVIVQELARLKGQFEDSPRVVIGMPADKLLRRDMSFPAATEENLRQVLAFEMDRQTPFSADQVYFDYRVVQRYPETKLIAVELVLMPRPLVNGWLERAEELGIGANAVDAYERTPEGPRLLGVNLLPADKRRNGAHRKRNINLALAAVLVALVATAMWLSLANKEQQLEALNAGITEAKAESDESRQLREELEDALQAANFLVQKKESHPALVDVLREVTHALPDDTSLQRLQIRDRELQLQGESDRTGPLLGLLGESPMLSQADFNGVTSVDQRTGKERFNIKAQVKPTGVGGGTASPEG